MLRSIDACSLSMRASARSLWTLLHVRCAVDSGEVDLGLADESFDVAKPLVVALRELGPFTDPVVRILLEAGAGANLDQYTGSIRATTVSALKKNSQLFGTFSTTIFER